MVIVLTSVDHINAPPDRVWQFLTRLHEADNYLRWHPKDHKDFKLLRGDGRTIGSTFEAVEILGDKTFHLRYRLNRTEPLKHLEYGASGLLRPLHLVSASFALKLQDETRTKLIATIRMGYKLPIFDWLIPIFANTDAIQKHMNEEGYYLNQALTK